MSHNSNRALLASSTKTQAIEDAPQNYIRTAMCWDGVFHYSPKSLSRRDFDHPKPIGREGLLTCLLHFSFRVKGIMISAVSQMPRQDLNTLRGLNISDSHHLAATFYLRGLLNTSTSPTSPPNTQFRGNFSTHPHIQKPGRTFKTPPFFVLPPTILHLLKP